MSSSDPRHEGEPHFQGIKKHHVSMLPVYEGERKESLHETLNILRAEKQNISLIPRTTHLFKKNIETLDKISHRVNEDENFITCTVEHAASHLGLTHKIVMEHSSGSILTFDGLHLISTQEITGESFDIDELLSRTGAPRDQYDVVHAFETIIREMYPDMNLRANPHYSYYTINNTNFFRLGIRREGRAQARLVLNDPRIFTITALIFSSQGKDFHVYIGEEDQINQMIAQDYFIGYELSRYISLFDNKIKKVIEYQEDIVDDFGGVLLSTWSIRKKNRMWNNVKKAITSLYGIQDDLEKGKLLVLALQELIDNKTAFFNGPRQIWILGEEQDFEEKIQHSTKHFYTIQMNGSELHAQVISDEPIEPFYTDSKIRLENKIQYAAKLTEEVYERERDLLTAYQTEFSLYAVWLSIIAAFLAILSIIDFNLLILNIRNFLRSVVETIMKNSTAPT